MTKTKKIIIGLLITVVSVLAVFKMLSVLEFFSLFIEQKPPLITEGEFPFVVEYEIDGERYIIEDTVVCSFDGYDHSAWFAKPRTWNEHLKSGDEDKRIILHEENNYSVLTPGRLNEQSRVVLNYGSGAYYMGDKTNSRSMIYAKPFFYYSERYQTDEKTTYNTGEKLSEKELEKHFGIKIIRFEFSKPIKNKFK
jgi:hypothetical protein